MGGREMKGRERKEKMKVQLTKQSQGRGKREEEAAHTCSLAEGTLQVLAVLPTLVGEGKGEKLPEGTGDF